MRFFRIIKTKTAIKVICTLTAVICAMSLVCSVCSGFEAEDDNSIVIIAYDDRCADTEQIEEDLRYLYNKGYSPVFASEAAKCLKGELDLPEKAVVLTFDGGYAGYYKKLFPLLVKYKAKADITVRGDRVEYASNSADDNAAYLRWDMIKEMDASGLVEFSNGTYSMNSEDFEQKTGEEYSHYRSRLIADIGHLQIVFQDNCGFEPCVFTYPDGKGSENSARFVRDLGFVGALGLENEKCRISGENKTDPYRIKRIDRAGADNLSDIL